MQHNFKPFIMKYLYTLVFTLAFALTTFAQNGFYAKYNITVEASGEEAEMMKMMMDGSTMELAANAERTWVKSQVGSMMTTEMEMNVAADEMTMYMSGMMGNMAFRGNPDSIDDAAENEDTEPKAELFEDTKTILGVECKKAVLKGSDGFTATYWYTEDFLRPEGMEQMPQAVPGLCLEFEVLTNGIKMIYTATKFDDNANMADYKLVVPEDVEIQSFEDMLKMGMGGN